jgi:hypothetical protein
VTYRHLTLLCFFQCYPFPLISLWIYLSVIGLHIFLHFVLWFLMFPLQFSHLPLSSGSGLSGLSVSPQCYIYPLQRPWGLSSSPGAHLCDRCQGKARPVASEVAGTGAGPVGTLWETSQQGQHGLVWWAPLPGSVMKLPPSRGDLCCLPPNHLLLFQERVGSSRLPAVRCGQVSWMRNRAAFAVLGQGFWAACGCCVCMLHLHSLMSLLGRSQRAAVPQDMGSCDPEPSYGDIAPPS